MLRIIQISAAVIMALILGGMTRQLWQHRFEAAKKHPSFNLDITSNELKRTDEGSFVKAKNAVIMRAATTNPRITFQWNKAPAYDYALVTFRISAKEIVPGNHFWENGRIELNWGGAQTGSKIRILSIWSASETKAASNFEAIVPMHYDPNAPRLIIHNLGRSGELCVEDFHFQPLQQQPHFQLKLTALLLAWGAWMFSLTFVFDRVSWWRRLLVAVSALWFTWYACFPGPWPTFRPLGDTFAISKIAPIPPPEPAPKAPVADNAPDTQAVTALSKLPIIDAQSPKASSVASAPTTTVEQAKRKTVTLHTYFARFTDWVFSTIPDLKRYLHMIVFGGLFIVLYLFAGERIALGTSTLLAGNSEFCEWAQGYGFEFGDVIDLTVDISGILLAWLLIRSLCKVTTRLFLKRKKADCPMTGESAF
jgi:hypothetical protein